MSTDRALKPGSKRERLKRNDVARRSPSIAPAKSLEMGLSNYANTADTTQRRSERLLKRSSARTARVVRFDCPRDPGQNANSAVYTATAL